ncbi:MAG: hypothetical protein J6K58_06845 [Lachnospiraceae bacterium]|nr:hypothetical protein [Lachnospiraceae bacterium]MBP3458909.1 hypothetical protein [Lachnospiraceae bacterium]
MVKEYKKEIEEIVVILKQLDVIELASILDKAVFAYELQIAQTKYEQENNQGENKESERTVTSKNRDNLCRNKI